MLRVQKDSTPNIKGEFTIFIVQDNEYVAVMKDEKLAQAFVDLYNERQSMDSRNKCNN